MSTQDLESSLQRLQNNPPSSPDETNSLLSHAKRQLLHLNALLPSPSTPPNLLHLGRSTLEIGALLSIRQQNPDAFTRYFQQLSPFYELPASSFSPKGDGQRSKVTGLYLLLLLTKGDYAEFHTLLESLEVEFGATEGKGLEADRFIGYPVKLERWLMEGSYDRVWKAVGREGVPSEEFGVFSEVCDHPRSMFKDHALIWTWTDPHRYDSCRDRVMLREGIPIPSSTKRQKSTFSR